MKKPNDARKASKGRRRRASRNTKAPRRARGAGALASSSHVTAGGGNVFADLGFSAEEAENLKVRSRLMTELRDVMESRGLTQVRAAKLFGVAQPRISDLKRGRIDRFTIDTLVNMLAHAGVEFRLSFGRSAA